MAHSSTPWTQGIQGREEQRQLKRQALLRTAARIFNKIGFHQTTLDDLAKALNVSKPALYHYVKNKDEILLECARLGAEHMQEALALASEQGTTGLEKLRFLFSRYAEVISEDFGACLILSRNQVLVEEDRSELRARLLELDLAVRRIIEEGIADGTIAPCDPKLTTFALFGAFNWIAQWYQKEGQFSPQQIAEQFLAVFENGLLPRNGP
jgi:AcrR family transcriptional regulator